MTFVGILKRVAVGAPVGIVALTALPIFGVVGTISAAGIAVGSLLGAAAGVADEFNWFN